jgi:hypothetical protein
VATTVANARLVPTSAMVRGVVKVWPASLDWMSSMWLSLFQTT